MDNKKNVSIVTSHFAPIKKTCRWRILFLIVLFLPLFVNSQQEMYTSSGEVINPVKNRLCIGLKNIRWHCIQKL